MSEDAIDALRRALANAAQVRDPAGRTIDALDEATMAVVFDYFDPEIEMHEDPRFPEAGVYRGRDAVESYFEEFRQSFAEFIYEVEDFIDLGGERVLVLLRLRTRGKGSGAVVEAQPGWIYTIRNGKAVKIEAYLNRDEALAAAGLAD
jgi:ketosteroid isomerase-like protein